MAVFTAASFKIVKRCKQTKYLSTPVLTLPVLRNLGDRVIQVITVRGNPGCCSPADEARDGLPDMA